MTIEYKGFEIVPNEKGQTVIRNTVGPTPPELQGVYTLKRIAEADLLRYSVEKDSRVEKRNSKQKTLEAL